MIRVSFLLWLAVSTVGRAGSQAEAARTCIKLLSGFETFLRVSDEEQGLRQGPDTAFSRWLDERTLVWKDGLLPHNPAFNEASGERLIHQMNYPFLAGPLDALSPGVGDSSRQLEQEKDAVKILKRHLIHTVYARRRLALFYRVRGRSEDSALYDKRHAEFSLENSLALRDRIRQNPQSIDAIGFFAVQNLLLSRPMELMTDVFAPIHLNELSGREYALLTDLLRESISQLRTDQPELFDDPSAR